MSGLECKNISKSYKDNKVLDNVSLTVKKGSIVGIVGRNGSGKTVLFKLICGFYSASDGEIIVDGKKLTKSHSTPENIGSIIETPGFLGSYSGYRNLKFLADIRNRIGKKEICEAIEMVGLDPKSRKHVRKYSLGMRQRLGLAQTFMEGQDILILDEPMNGLDNESVAVVRKILKEQAENGATIILASHNREDIDVLCDKVYTMDHGVIECER